jgi:hypothetical protein
MVQLPRQRLYDTGRSKNKRRCPEGAALGLMSGVRFQATYQMVVLVAVLANKLSECLQRAQEIEILLTPDSKLSLGRKRNS